MSDVYRKTGRGGAGNFYSKQDIEQAEQAKATDVQSLSTADW